MQQEAADGEQRSYQPNSESIGSRKAPNYLP
jgi:hypothetical protein